MTAATYAGTPTVESVIDRFVVVIGAQRCGSTLLHRMLDAHPEISMVKPARPEPKIFLDAELTAADLRRRISERLTSLDPAADLFGEKSTSYIESPLAADNIRRLVPDARIVAIVRNPIDRAVSNHRFSVANGLESDPLEVALERELEGWIPERLDDVSVSPFAYLGRGCYVDHLARYEELFGHDRLSVLMLEELIDRPESIATLYRRLGAAESFRPPGMGTVNAAVGKMPQLSSRMRSRLADYFRSGNAELAERYSLDILRWN
ncbi:MAG: sulfotransferase [Acidimicrobiia bacterium]|nr:sulfotransferase [Acidimicrobiia bacterium]MDH5519007.1 sulfotransferase [Acidimicrobiia bacterium]